ncbi:MAG: pyridoxamine 5'-phosphate oxidase family protein [Dehalococcoidia bacterium]|nr:pyridoxamine 5'-phosphate oxidase family protein [Dehalococcoidia bacterium]
MAVITEEMRGVVEQAKVVVLATVSKEGKPNAVPIAFKEALSGDEILLADNFMKKTVENIKVNPVVAVSAWHKDSSGNSRGYQFKGEARIETSGRIFDEGVRIVKAADPELTPKGAVIVKVDSVYSISPGPDAGRQIS